MKMATRSLMFSFILLLSLGVGPLAKERDLKMLLMIHFRG
jgi:hypothetical protein